MAWKKATEEINALHSSLVAPYPCQRRQMFGFQVFFINNNMFTGIYEDGMILRLPAAEQAQMMAANDEVTPFTPQGRRMNEYVFIPEPVMNNRLLITDWMQKSYAYTKTLPPKEKKPQKRSKKE